MKFYSKLLSVLMLVVLFASCDKKDKLNTFTGGNAPRLEANTVNVAPQAADSNSTVLTLRWSDPRYSANMSTKYIVEIDSVGKNFSNPITREFTGANQMAWIAKDLNNELLARGYAFNVPVSMEARVISSLANNNERLASNRVLITMRPYRIPPRVALPGGDRLYITGGTFGWNNTDPMPAYQELTKIDATTWEGIFNFNAGSGYLFLPQTALVNWSDKYGWAGPNMGNNPAGDVLLRGGGDIAAPNTAGPYRVRLDFQQGRFTVTPVANAIPDELFITGNAVPSNWTNTPPTTQRFTRLSNGIFRLQNVAFQPGNLYKFLTGNGQWQPQFGGSSATGGTLGANWGSGGDPDAIPTPATAGNYTITVNFLNMTYTVTQ